MSLLGSFAISSSSVDSESSFEVNFLKWEDCDTVGKKIGYIVGRSINFMVSTGCSLFNKVTGILPFGKVGNLFATAFKWTTTTASYYLKRMYQISTNCIRSIFINNTTKSLAENVRKWILNPLSSCISKIKQFATYLWNNALSPLHKKVITPIFNCLKSIVTKIMRLAGKGILYFSRLCLKVCKSIANWTVVPLYKNLLSPLMKKIGMFISQKIKSAYHSKCRQSITKVISQVTSKIWSVVKTTFNWTVKPFFNRLVTPCFSGACDLVWGIFSGCCITQAKKTERVEKEDNLTSDSEETSDDDSKPGVIETFKLKGNWGLTSQT